MQVGRVFRTSIVKAIRKTADGDGHEYIWLVSSATHTANWVDP